MKSPAPLTIWLAIGGLQRATLACLGVTVILLLASLILIVPGVAGAVLATGPKPPAWGVVLQLVPVLTGVMGLITAALCLGVGTEIAPETVRRGGKDSPIAVLAELRSLLARERQELIAVQTACETANRETAAAGERLAKLVARAEARLTPGTDPASSASAEQAANVARAADMVVRLERLVPMISRVVEPEASASVITGAAEAMERAITAAVSGAAGQIATIGEAASTLRRDASTLDKAAREFAIAGANVVSRVGEAAVNVETVAATLPSATENLSATARRATDTLGQASSALSANAESLRANAASLHETGESFTQRLAGAGKEIDARLASFPALSQVLGTQAGQLLRNAESLIETTREAAQASDSTAASAARVDSIVTGLSELAGQITTWATMLKENADGLQAASRSVVTDSSEAAGRIEAAAREVLAALPQASKVVGVSCAALREQAGALGREVTALAEAGQQAARLIAAETAQTRSLAHGLTEVSAELGSHVENVGRAATLVTERSRAAGDALKEEIARATSSLNDAAGNAGRVVETAAAAVTASLSEASAVLDTSRTAAAEATAVLAEEAGALSDAGQSLEHGTESAIEQICAAMQAGIDGFATAGAEAGERLMRTGETLEALDKAAAATASSGDQATEQLGRLSAVCTQAEAQAAALPTLATRIEAVIGLIEKAAKTMPQPEVLTDLSRATKRLPKIGESLERVARELPALLDARTAASDEVLGSLKQMLGVLSADVGETIRRLEGACAATDAAGALMSASVAQVQSAAESVAQVAAEGSDEATSRAPLRHLGSLEREAAALMREGEVLAEAAAAGRTDEVPAWLVDRTTEVLSAVDTTIHRLRSVATAIAFASDAVTQPARVA